jgi:hypothetical protein
MTGIGKEETEFEPKLEKSSRRKREVKAETAEERSEAGRKHGRTANNLRKIRSNAWLWREDLTIAFYSDC